LDSFDDRYLGTKTSDPTLDNDGNALVSGALYFSTTQNVMKVYDGASWITATSAGATSMLRFRYVATSGQTTFSGADAASATLTYTVNNIAVHRNGVTLDTSEYTASNGTSIVLAVAAGTGDIIDIIAFKSFTVADALSTVSGGTVNGAVVITGVTTVQAGTAALPAITTTGDTNTGIFFPAADTIAFAEGGAEAMRIDSSGNLGLGVTPSAWGSAYSKAIQISTQGAYVAGNTTGYSGGTYAWFGNNGYLDSAAAFRYTISTSACQYQQVANSHQWLYAPNGTAGGLISFSEAMRIDSSGNLLVGTTTATGRSGVNFRVGAAAAADNDTGYFLNTSNNHFNVVSHVNTTSGTRYHVGFGDGTTWTERGTISTNGSATTYSTSSDYRLKEDVQPMAGALAKVAQLKPCTYTWKESGIESQGFIAHELQEVVPDAVTGTKDATREEQYEVTPAVKDADGNVVTDAVMGTRTVPDYQGIDTSFLVATLTAAIQELNAKFEEYKAAHP